MTPQLRFPQFTDEWQVKKLGELFSYEQPTKYLVSSTDYAEEYNTPVLTAGKTFVLGKTNEFDGIFRDNLPITLFDDFTTASQWVDFPFKLKSSAAKILKAKSGYNPKIAHEVLQKIRFKADDHQRYWISTYQNFDVKIPSKPEQEKIADFLTAVDERIRLQEQKLAKLEQYKRGVMQQIFSQKIRFKDENGNEYPEWDENKLGELGKFTSGVGFTNSEQGGKYGTPFYKVSDMNLSGNTNEMTQANNYVSDTQVIDMKYKPIIDKSIIFAKVGAAIFLERKRVASNFLIDNNMMAFTPNGNLDFQYIKIVFDRLHLSKMAQVGALPSYNGSDLAIIKIQLPSHKEQEKIAIFLTALDDKITAEKSKLTTTKQFKKALLQRMFV